MNPSCYSPWGLGVHFLRQYWDLGSESLSCRVILESVPIAGQSTGWMPYLQVFLTTCVLEAPLYFFLFRWRSWSRTQSLLACLSLNLLTHPIVYFGFPELSARWSWPYGKMLGVAEIFAPLIEAIALLALFGFWRGPRAATCGVVVAVVANLASWWVGVYL